MQVSQVAYDRFVLELPAADATWRPLADAECLAEAAAGLWDFGPTPLVAVAGHERAAPSGLTGRPTPQARRGPAGGAVAPLQSAAKPPGWSQGAKAGIHN